MLLMVGMVHGRQSTVDRGLKIKAVLPKYFGSERDCRDPEV